MTGLRRAQFAVFGLLLAALFAVSSSSARAEQVQNLPQPTDYVSDFAHVLTPATVAQIDNICAQLDHSAANAQIAVVTVQNLDGDDAADFANALEDKWEMGKKGTDRGLLILLAVDDHKYRIEVGYDLEGILPDGKVGDIGRAMVPYLRTGDYDSAVTLAVDQVAQVIAADAKVTLTNQPAMPAPQPQRAPGGVHVLQLIVLAVFILFYLFRGLGSFGLFGAWGLGLMSGGFFGGGGGAGGGGGSGGGGDGFSGFGGFGGGFGGGGAGGSW